MCASCTTRSTRGDRVTASEQLIQILDALFTRVFRQCDRHSNEMADGLDLVRVLPGDGRGALQNRVSIDRRLHDVSLASALLA